MNERIIVWFSCGAASAVAAKKTIERYPDDEVLVVNCDTRPNEHPDNYRFCEDVQRWIGRQIVYIKSNLFSTIDDVFEKTKYMSGVKGARCTTELKKKPRHQFGKPDDCNVFGFTFEESKRLREFRSRNPELKLRFVLSDMGITKQDCFKELLRAGIDIPQMYKLGFKNNNCIGCVKSSSPWYWDKIRTLFPDVFQRRCEQSRNLGVRLVEIHSHERIFLDELPTGPFKSRGKLENISCGPECGTPP